MGDCRVSLTKNELVQNSSHESAANLLKEFGSSFAYGFFQEPVDGVTQLLDKTTGSKLLPSLHFFDEPAQQKFATKEWHAQQLGAAAGMVVPFLLLHKAVNSSSGKIVGNLHEGAALKAKLIGETAATGALYCGVFKPSAATDTDFTSSRLKDAFVGALTFSSFAAANMGLKSAAEMHNVLRNSVETAAFKIGTSTISGLPAGIISAESQALLHSKRPASPSELLQSAYSFAFIGGALSVGQLALEPRSIGSKQRSVSDSEFRKLQTSENKMLFTAFELRADQRGISKQKQIEALSQVNRIIEAGDSSGKFAVDRSRLKQIARETLENIARPSSIDQGDHPTCVLNSIENIIASNHPDKYAKLIADLSLNGEAYSTSGHGLRLPERCLKPDSEAKLNSRKDANRCYASQLCQYFLANLHWAEGGELPTGDYADEGTVVYQPIAAGENKAGLYHNGKLLKDYGGGGKEGFTKVAFEGPEVLDYQIVSLFRKIVPRGRIQVIDHADGIERSRDESGRKTVKTIKTEKDLEQLLEVMDQDITICGVRTEALGGSNSGWHAVVLRDYDPRSKTVYLDNSWGQADECSGKKGQRKRLTLKELFELMKPPADDSE